ncbi:hypothetical protein [Microlunatus parietis]|uniref:Glycosyl hydrolase family 76 n=1 Tax=Microlunatus parietis TaxID=682979 RepID=A0A7Y9IC56_9ACTN|nr:hypothetical protein [Microlunatus parietis]NYE73883.1 hypothetical protein [Microlunatus parietis]
MITGGGPRFGRRTMIGIAVGTALAAAGLRTAAAAVPVSATRAAFDAADLAFNGGWGVADATNEQGLYSWQESAVLKAYVLMYRAHRDPYYLDKFIAHGDLVLANRDSVRGVTDYRGRSLPAWRNFKVTVDPVSTSMLIGVDTGNITYGMTMFARTIMADSALRRVRRYDEAARRFRDAAVRAVAVHDADFKELGSRSGSYTFAKGSPYVVDGIEYPVNMDLAMGASVLSLWHLTRDRVHLDRARRLAVHWRADWDRLADGAVVWPHQHKDSWAYRGWSAADGVSVNMPSYNPNTRVEDLGHGQMCVEFAELAHRSGLYRRDDLVRLARTLSRHTITEDAAGDLTVYERIDGSRADAGRVKQELYAGGWLPLDPYAEDPLQPRIGAILDQNLDQNSPGLVSVRMLAMAYANYARTRRPVSDYP